MQIAVILFNLGGPDSLQAVKPFLFNLFNDPNIITLPQPFRYFLAKLISHFRQEKSRNIYKQMGGKSTILPETEKQAKALSKLLNQKTSMLYDVLPMMRYWHPMSDIVIKKVRDKKYDRVILVPLYPHFSTTTTFSSLKDWFQKASDIKSDLVCCYYNHPGFIAAHLDLIKESLEKFKTKKPIRLLFSAHSIPQKISDGVDPYKDQIEQTVALIMQGLPNFAYSLCYQSKVGRLKWLEPSLENELIATNDRKESALVIPIAFTSEHSETLVELDLDYAKLAKEMGLDFCRVPTLSSHPLFIATLADLVMNQLSIDPIYDDYKLYKGYYEENLNRVCDAKFCCKKLSFYKPKASVG